MAKSKVGQTVENLGEYLRDQRVGARLTLRQLAEQAGVSNPYLSQIERGLRRPSAEVLQQLARALRISAETLYVRAGILNPDDDETRSVELAVLADTGLTERQKQSLLDVYASFRAANAAAAEAESVGASAAASATASAAATSAVTSAVAAEADEPSTEEPGDDPAGEPAGEPAGDPGRAKKRTTRRR